MGVGNEFLSGTSQGNNTPQAPTQNPQARKGVGAEFLSGGSAPTQTEPQSGGAPIGTEIKQPRDLMGQVGHSIDVTMRGINEGLGAQPLLEMLDPRMKNKGVPENGQETAVNVLGNLGTSIATMQPLESMVTKAYPALSLASKTGARILPSALREGITFGLQEGVKGAVEAVGGKGGVKDTVGRMATGAGLGAGGAVTGRIAAPIVKKVKKALPQGLEMTPLVEGTMKKAISVLAGGMFGNLTAMDQPIEARAISTGMGALGGLMGGGGEEPKSGIKKGTRIRGDQAEGTIPTSAPIVIPPTPEQLAQHYIDRRTKQLAQEHKDIRTAKKASLIALTKLGLRGIDIDPELHEIWDTIHNTTKMAEDALNRNDLTTADALTREVERLTNEKLLPSAIEQQKIASSKMKREAGFPKGKSMAIQKAERTAAHQARMESLRVEVSVPDSVIEDAARQKATMEALQKSWSHTPEYKAGIIAEEELKYNIANGIVSSDAHLKMNPETQAWIDGNIATVGAPSDFANWGATADTVAQEFDKGNRMENTPFYNIILKPILMATYNAKKAHTDNILSIRNGLKDIGFKIGDFQVKHIIGANNLPIIGEIMGHDFNDKQIDLIDQLVQGFNPKLPVGQERMYREGAKFIRAYFDNMHAKMEAFIRITGKAGFKYIENYRPWIEQYGSQVLKDMFIDQPVSQPSRWSKAKSMTYRFLHRKDEPIKTVNLMKSIEMYSYASEMAYHLQGQLETVRYAVKKAADAGRQDVANVLDKWATAISNTMGHSALDVVLSKLVPGGNFLGNVYGNQITSFSTALRQVMQIPFIAASKEGQAIGLPATLRNTFEGLYINFASNIAKSQFDHEMPNFGDQSTVKQLRVLSNSPGLTGRTNGYASFIKGVVSHVDLGVCDAAYKTGYDFAIKNGMSHPKALDYADRFSMQINGVYDRMFRPQLLQGKFGRFILPFTTQAFSNLNTLVNASRDVSLTQWEKYKVIGGTLAGSILLSIASSLIKPEPGGLPNAASQGVTDMIPGFSSIARGTLPGMAGVAGKVIGNPSQANIVKTAALLAGVQGSEQLIKQLSALQAFNNNGHIRKRNGQVDYTFDTSDPVDLLRAFTFGPANTESGSKSMAKAHQSTIARILSNLDETAGRFS